MSGSPRPTRFPARIPYIPDMLTRPRTLPVDFIQPCLPIKAPKPPTGAVWLREIKHDGFRVIAGKDDGEALWKLILVPLLPCFGAF